MMRPGRTRPAGNAQAMLNWRVNVGTATPFSPSVARITPPDERIYLRALWQGGPVLGGDIVSWPLRVAPAGPFPAVIGTIANPFNGMCIAVSGDGATVVAWKCSRGAAAQRWTCACRKPVPPGHMPNGRWPVSAERSTSAAGPVFVRPEVE